MADFQFPMAGSVRLKRSSRRSWRAPTILIIERFMVAPCFRRGRGVGESRRHGRAHRRGKGHGAPLMMRAWGQRSVSSAGQRATAACPRLAWPALIGWDGYDPSSRYAIMGADNGAAAQALQLQAVDALRASAKAVHVAAQDLR